VTKAARARKTIASGEAMLPAPELGAEVGLEVLEPEVVLAAVDLLEVVCAVVEPFADGVGEADGEAVVVVLPVTEARMDEIEDEIDDREATMEDVDPPVNEN